MQKIKALYTQLQQTAFEKRYPNFNPQDNKVHLLFVAPCLNAKGYYRVIAPSAELNRTGEFSAIITSLHKWDFNKRFDDYDSPIDEKLIRWADYVIFPTVFTNISYIIKAMMTINDDVQFVMDLDKNYHTKTAGHLPGGSISDQAKNQLLSNLSKMDIITAGSEGLIDYYDDLLSKHYPNAQVFTEYVPSLISQVGYSEVKPLKRNKSGKVRIALIGSNKDLEDFALIGEVLKGVHAVLNEQMELVLFGWNPNKGNNPSFLEGVPYTFQKSVAFTDYFDTLNELQCDVALLPLRDIPYNTMGKSFINYLELSVYAVPVVASDVDPYRAVVDHGETGFLANTSEDWYKYITQLASDKSMRHRIGANALKQAWKHYSFTSSNLQIYQAIFI